MKFKIFLFIIILSVLFLAARGLPGNPAAEDLNSPKWIANGPFELSPERGRFALLYSLVENHSFFFTVPVARFAIPDLGYKNNHYVSLFAPAVSYIVIPGYLAGRALGSSQFGAYFVISLFALFNFFLLRAIAVKMGINQFAATLGAVAFLFATPAFSYSATLYQHHISAFLILAALYLTLCWNNWWSTCLIWFLCAVSIPVDYPNLFLMLPIGIYVSGRLISAKLLDSGLLKIRIKLAWWLTLLSILVPLAFFCWFNYRSYGNPFQFSGTVPDVAEIDSFGQPTAPSAYPIIKSINQYVDPELQQKSAVSFFETRNILNGLYIHLLSPDRGVLFFAPVVLLGILGGFYLQQRKVAILPVLVGIIGMDLLLYSMWGDPWGGWAFGSRYLIPAYAILCLLLAQTLDRLKHNLIFIVFFLLLFIYSAGVNTLGAITTGENPPRIQVLALEKASGRRELYSFDRNFEYLLTSGSKSYVYRAFAAGHLSAFQYYLLITALPVFLGVALLGYLNIYVRD